MFVCVMKGRVTTATEHDEDEAAGYSESPADSCHCLGPNRRPHVYSAAETSAVCLPGDLESWLENS